MDLNKVIEALKGYKTYIAIALAVLVELLAQFGLISADSSQTYLSIIAGLGGMAFVAKINRWSAAATKPPVQ